MKAPKVKVDLKALKNIDFSKAVELFKRRGVILVSCVVIVIVPFAALWFRSSMTDDIAATMEQRQKDFEKIAAMGKTSVSIRSTSAEPEKRSVVLNMSMIEAVKERNLALEDEFKFQYTSAVERNAKDHVFAPAHDQVEIFPNKPKDVVLEEVYLGKKYDGDKDLGTGINSAYESLISNSRAGQPPTPAEVLESVQRRETEFIQNNLKKNSRAEVTEPNDLKDLANELRMARITNLQEKAKDISMYLDPNAIRMPPTEGKTTLARCFVMQWDLWILQDIFAAIANANAGVKDGVLSAPIKRIMSIRIKDIQAQVAAAVDGAPAPEEVVETVEAAPTEAAPTEAGSEPVDEVVEGDPISPSTAIPLNYASSFTGLTSCQLYDVRNVNLELVVATAELPRIFNSFTRQNFMAITNLKYKPVNLFQAARMGYLYGTEACCQITMTVQTIWLREWTTKKMPKDLKKLLWTQGVATPKPVIAEPNANENPETTEAPQS